MTEIEFLGQSDENFKAGDTYKLIEFGLLRSDEIYIFVLNKHGEVVYIPYSTLGAFNENWRVI